jgi:hypothetical protein
MVAVVVVAMTAVVPPAPKAEAAPVDAGVTATVSAPSVDEGTRIDLEAAYDGRGGDPVEFRIRWGDDSDVSVVLSPDTAATFEAVDTHRYGDDGSFTIAVKVPAANGKEYRGTVGIEVANVAPIIDPLADAFAPLGGEFTIDIGFADPGTADTHTVTQIDWGDGDEDRNLAIPDGDRVARLTHTYDDEGTFRASLTIRDDDGGSDSASFGVTVGTGCGGYPVTIDVGALNLAPGEKVIGTPGRDVILGTDGNDRINAKAGDDIVCGKGGNDIIFGGAGDDELRGGSGADTLKGGSGDDVLIGGKGNDKLVGSSGSDVAAGGPGKDTANGGGGDDVLHGGQGADVLTGRAGDDFLFNSEFPNRDEMTGGKGTDLIGVGKRGNDRSGLREYVTDAEVLEFRAPQKLSDFTTYHACCQNRVTNIQTMAGTINGYLVLPGETFTVNTVVGRRTTEKGYVLAGAIIGGYVQCCDLAANLGGGTSQFGTTIYNAIFFSGLEDVDHTPHSLYFSRYPAGREATMGYPGLDVAFRNDTDTAVLITTHFVPRTGTSIRVKFWGDNGGRTVTATHSCNAPGTSIFPEVEAARGACGTFTSSAEVYEADASMDPGDESRSPGQAGFRISVDRTITYADGSEKVETFEWLYSASPTVITTHPCNIPAGEADYTGEACPGGGGGGGGGGGIAI